MTSLGSDLRVAVRTLLRSPGFSLTVIMTLAVGMGATGLVFSVINAQLLRPLPFPDIDRIVAVSTVGELAFLQQEPLALDDYRDITLNVPSFSDVVAHQRKASVVGSGPNARVALGEHVSTNYFSALGAPLALGRGFAPNDDPERVVVLSHAVWEQRFGGAPEVLGQTMDFGNRPRTVVGVTRRGFTGVFRGIAPEYWVPLGEKVLRQESRETLDWWVHAKLADGATTETAGQQLAALAADLGARYPSTNAGRSFRVEPLASAALHPAIPRALLSAGALGVLAVASLVLLVASINVAHLVMARATTRQRELAIRSAVGGTRARLVRLLLIEGALLSASSAVLSLVFTAWAGRAISAVRLPVAIAIDLDVTLDDRVILFTLLVALCTAILFSLGPALRATRMSLTAVLGRGATAHVAIGAVGRKLMLGGQAAAATLLMILAGLALRSLMLTTEVDPGFNSDGVTVASAAPQLGELGRERANDFYAQVAQRVSQLPGVQSVSWVHPVPMSLNIRITRLRLPGQEVVPARQLPIVDTFIAWPGLFRSLQIPVTRGREFVSTDVADAPRVALVNETFVQRYWPNATPLGQRIAVGYPEPRAVEVVGVVKDIKNRTLGDIPRPMVFTAGPQDAMGWQAASLVVRSSPDQSLNPRDLTAAIRSIDPAVPVFDVQSMADRMGGVLLLPRYAATLFGTIGLTALGLSAVGLFGIVAFATATRTRELGLRLALGSTRRALVWLVTRQTLLPVAVGMITGIVTALGAARALSLLLYGVAPHDPLVLFTGALLLLVTCSAASVWPALRAARLDPAAALRD